MKIKATSKDAHQLFLQGAIALSQVSMNGMGVDVGYCKKQYKYLDKKIQKLERPFRKSKTGVLWKKVFKNPNFNSDDQLRTILFDKKKLKVIKLTKRKKPSVDNETLEILSKQVPELKGYSDYKNYLKLKNTFMAGILREQVDGRIHPFYHLHIARTFRSSSSNINFQNQPNRDKKQKKIIRNSFIPTRGNRIVAADFKGIEVGISCCNHKDPMMIKYVKDPKSDMHGDLAQQVFMLDRYLKEGSEEILRKGTKNGFTFPQFYGSYYANNAPILCSWAGLPNEGSFKKTDGLKLMTGLHLGQHLLNKGIKCFNDFEDHIADIEDDFWERRFKGYAKWKRQNVKKYYKKGYLKTLTGFTCSGLMGKNDINNYPIQGPAFHCLLKVLIEVNRVLTEQKWNTKLIGQIHDELVFDADPREVDDLLELIRKTICIWLPSQWDWIIIPLEVEADVFEQDATWATKPEKFKLAA